MWKNAYFFRDANRWGVSDHNGILAPDMFDDGFFDVFVVDVGQFCVVGGRGQCGWVGVEAEVVPLLLGGGGGGGEIGRGLGLQENMVVGTKVGVGALDGLSSNPVDKSNKFPNQNVNM